MRALRLPVGAKRRGNPFPFAAALNKAKAKETRIATACCASFAMTKSDFYDSLSLLRNDRQSNADCHSLLRKLRNDKRGSPAQYWSAMRRAGSPEPAALFYTR